MAKVKTKASKKANTIAVNGSFLDIMQASVKQANKKSAKKKP
jgi:hypothetical protein